MTGGVATLTTTTLPVGADSLTAVFAGDSNYKPSTSNILSVTVATILVSSNLNPSAYAQPVMFTATVSSGISGTVTFKDGGTAIGTGTISSSTATLTTSTLSIGSHNITASYSSVTSPTLVQVVNKATPDVKVSTSGDSTYGDTVTITAKVPAGANGTITFTSGTLALGSGTVAADGTVTITTTALQAGADTITASYGGDGNYNSATGNAPQNVAKATITTTLTSSANPSIPGDAVTFTRHAVPAGLTGTVTFTSGTTTLGTSTVTNGGAVTVTTSTLPLGDNPIVAVYSGDTNYNSSTAKLTQTVAKSTPTISVTTRITALAGDCGNDSRPHCLREQQET